MKIGFAMHDPNNMPKFKTSDADAGGDESSIGEALEVEMFFARLASQPDDAPEEA